MVVAGRALLVERVERWEGRSCSCSSRRASAAGLERFIQPGPGLGVHILPLAAGLGWWCCVQTGSMQR